MQLPILLLVVVAILTALSGVAVISGAHKGDRVQAFLFFLTTMAALTWASGVGIFMTLPDSNNPGAIKVIIDMMYIGAPTMCWGLMAYTCNKYKIGRIGMAILGAVCLIIASLIIINPSLLYSGYTIDARSGNILHVSHGWFYTVFYSIYHIVAVSLCITGLAYTASHAKISDIKKANWMVFTGFFITGMMALVFNLILPYFGIYSTVWAGPLAMSVAWVMHYFAILRYRLLNLSSPWMKSLSRLIVVSLAAITYMVAFFLIFMALFNVQTPSWQVILLNMLMIITVMLLFPAINELSSFVGSLASTTDVDVAYMVKKLTMLVGYNVNMKEIAVFLRNHLHFRYVGLVIGGEIYGLERKKLPVETIERVSKLRGSSSIWLTPDEELDKALKKQNIVAVAELRDSKGRVIGQVLFGEPSGDHKLKDRDLVPIEIILQVVSVVVRPGDYQIKKHLI